MPRRFLIIQTAFIGDVVLATSLIENLHKQYPDASIDFLLRKGNEDLLLGHPYLNNILIWDKKKNKILNLLKLVTRIRKTKYDEVINVQRYAATGLLTTLSGAGRKTGFDKNPFSRFFSKRIPHSFAVEKNGLHETQRNHALIAHLTSDPLLKPKLYPTVADEDHVRPLVRLPYITISPASVWFTKQYPLIKWKEFVDTVPMDFTIYLLGGRPDRSLAGSLVEQSAGRKMVNLCGELNFLQSAALMRQAQMNYVNDSAPMHFCSAANAPVTVVYCSTIPAFGYGPLSDIQFIVERIEPLYCRPCGLHGHKKCPEGHFRCALDISVSQLNTFNQ
ncbi:MAG TPA: glycosyltransferase family 9 protein [Flavitalea sp.]|nr:glycosyltransferase family 9 protein [Flavitalea sp.]